MPRLPFVAVAALVFILPATAADPAQWGPLANGLRMSIAISSGRQSELVVTVQNSDSKPLLLPLGSLIGSQYYNLRFRPILTTPHGRDQQVIFSGTPAGLGGRMDPLVPDANFSVSMPLAKLFVVNGSKLLDTFLSQQGRLRVELDVQNAVCPLYGYPNPNMITCWHGKATSNVVQFPTT